MQDIRPARKRGRTLVSGQQILQCIVDLHTSNPQRLATRKAIAEELALPFQIVDEHIDRLLAKGLINRVIAGVFEPAHIRPHRAVTLTTLPSGELKIEIGEQVLDVDAWEASVIMHKLRGSLERHRPASLPKKVVR